MHRHSYQGRKLNRTRGPRRALLRGLVTSLVLHESITTTEAKAKEIVRYFEQVATQAKKGDLANLRHVRTFLLTENATQKLVQDLIPAFGDRTSGRVRVIKSGNRLGDNAPMAVIALIRSDKPIIPAEKSSEPAVAEVKPAKPAARSSKPTKAKPKAKAAQK